MATSKTAQLTDFARDILGRYICDGFDEAIDSMDNNSPGSTRRATLDFSTPSSSGALTACWRSICSMPTTPTATKFSFRRADGIRCRSISRIFPCSGNLHRGSLASECSPRLASGGGHRLEAKAFLPRMTSIRARRMRRNLFATRIKNGAL
jgi:hypothetical protein